MVAHVDLSLAVGAINRLPRLSRSDYAETIASISVDACNATASDWRRVQDARIYFDKKHVLKWAKSHDLHRHGVLSMMTLCADGYAREAAIVALAKHGEPRSLLPLVPRTCDWVAEVGDAALAAVRSLLASCGTEQLVDLVDGFDEWLRRRFPAAGHQCADLLQLELTNPRHFELVGRMRTDANARRRVFATTATLSEVLASDELIVRGLHDESAFVRIVVLDGLLKAPVAVQARHARMLMTQCGDRVLRRFLPRCDDSVLQQQQDLILQLATCNRQGRRRAAQAVVAASKAPLLQFCTSRLPLAEPLAIAGILLCIGECGFAQLAATVAPYLQHEHASVRAAAIMSTARLVAFEPADAVALLEDPHPQIRKAGSWVLQRMDRWRWAPAVRRLAQTGAAATRLAAMRILTHRAARRSWDVVPDLLFAIMREPSLRERCDAQLDGWFARNGARGWLRPDSETRAWLAVVLPEWESNQQAPWFARSNCAGWIRSVLAKDPR